MRVGEPVLTLTRAPPGHPIKIHTEQPGGPTGRPARGLGTVDQDEQAGLGVRVHPGRDRAGA